MSGNRFKQFARVFSRLTHHTVGVYYLRSVALFLAALIAINLRSFPLIWHARVLRHLLGWNLRMALAPNKQKFVEDTSPVAKDPFKTVVTHKYWAGPDDCDFLGHLSNSAYAKNLDIARMKVCVTNLRPFMLEGGWMPLAGADYAFLSEIPLFSHYEVRAKVSAWDEKWIYLHSEFITRPNTSKTVSKVESAAEVAAEMTLDIPKHRPRTIRPDGTILHCIAISRYCFKLGRLTVPPRIALAVCGFGIDRSNWIRSASMQAHGDLKRFLEGGWRDEKGWDLAEFEQQRLAGMEWCRQLTQGINSASW